MPDEMTKGTKGAFFSSLKRNNKQIRDDRAEAIAMETEMMYRREAEELEMNITRMKWDQQNMLDLSPSHAQSLIVASDFNGKEFVEKDIELSVKIWNAEQKLALIKARYNLLFSNTMAEES